MEQLTVKITSCEACVFNQKDGQVSTCAAIQSEGVGWEHAIIPPRHLRDNPFPAFCPMHQNNLIVQYSITANQSRNLQKINQ